MLDVLMEGPLPAGEIARHFPDITRPAVSQHLAVLREADLVREHREGRHRIYTLQPERLEMLWTDWLSRYQKFWRMHLRDLKEVVERDNPRTTAFSRESGDIKHSH
ncbi:helix-turn-helix transcriptional regulator [Sulfobacillus sp. DSM 109850]|uniref:Helix-turn-helix transcriptional regulator n=1 Tax=Sulfobacillus harzensis TaxID=2729629 RepID=A0A7Y0L626_9FIRM|nr:helix-turn-helix transcriptional regulator [Sulfobacillus harzensis]